MGGEVRRQRRLVFVIKLGVHRHGKQGPFWIRIWDAAAAPSVPGVGHGEELVADGLLDEKTQGMHCIGMFG